MNRPHFLLPALCITLIVSWGSLYYAFSVLARPIQVDRQWDANSTVGAYSLALLVSGLCAYPVGRVIDRFGGRGVMALGSGLAGTLFLALSQVQSSAAFYAVWIGLGVAMSMTLYEPAFGVVVAVYKAGYRRSISVLTLAGGFASTVFWPLTHVMVEQWGWRGCAVALGLFHLLLCLPLHWLAIPAATTAEPAAPSAPAAAAAEGAPPADSPQQSLLRTPSFWLMGLSFMAFGFVTSSVAVHAIPLIESRGWSPAAAVALAAFIGPMQSAGRAAELVLGNRLPALWLGSATVLLMPLALAALWLAPPQSWLVYAFVLLHGAGMGLTTIVRATSPAEMFGKARYASTSGALATPSLLARAAGPLAATWLLGTSGQYSVALLGLLIVGAAGAVFYWAAVGLHRQASKRIAPV